MTTTTNPDDTTSVHVEGSLAIPVTFMVVGSITSLGFFIWNVCLRQGRTGASARACWAIRTVSMSEGRGRADAAALITTSPPFCCQQNEGALAPDTA